MLKATVILRRKPDKAYMYFTKKISYDARHQKEKKVTEEHIILNISN